MALINCKECKREISDKARSCPGCGMPLELNESQGIDSFETKKTDDETLEIKDGLGIPIIKFFNEIDKQPQLSNHLNGGVRVGHSSYHYLKIRITNTGQYTLNGMLKLRAFLQDGTYSNYTQHLKDIRPGDSYSFRTFAGNCDSITVESLIFEYLWDRKHKSITIDINKKAVRNFLGQYILEKPKKVPIKISKKQEALAIIVVLLVFSLYYGVG